MQFDAGWHYGYILSKDSKGNKWVKDQGWKCWEDKNFQNGRREEEDQGKETEKTWSEKEVEGQEKQRVKSRVMEWREESEREEGQVEKRGKRERTTRGVLKITQGGSWSRMRGEWMEMSVYYVLLCGTGLDIYKITPLNTYRINFLKKINWSIFVSPYYQRSKHTY